MGYIGKYSLIPNPHVFEVWYVYCARLSPEIVRAIDIFKGSSKDITTEHCEEIYQRFLSEGKDEEIVQRAGNEINTTLESVGTVIKEAQTATSEYRGSLTEATEKLSSQSDKEEVARLLKQVSDDTAQMIERNQALEDELNKSSSAMAELQRDLESVRKEAMTDGLTGLSNRKAFDNEMHRAVKSAAEEGDTFTLLMLDIDHFKDFNDTYGHQVGDQVLRLVAKCMTNGIKGQDVAARYGGEEFAIILPETNINAGVVVANNLRKTVSQKDIINRSTGEKMGRITLSVGVAQYNGSESVDDLILRADKALYKAKRNGRDQVATITPGSEEKNADEHGHHKTGGQAG